MKKRNNIYLALLMCLFLGACEEDVVDEFTPVEEKWDSLSDFIESTESEKTITISTSKLPKGLHILRVIDETQHVTSLKILIQ
jgi:hypothetical protein